MLLGEAFMAKKDELGRFGECVAAHHLESSGYRIIERNWRCTSGEIDIIAEDQSSTVFVEVKTRSSLAFGHPFDAVTPAKLVRLRRLAAAWCNEAVDRPVHIRIDVVGVLATAGCAPG